MATVKEIAERAGVSIGTVDRVVHQRGRVSKETKLRIEAILNELNYQPNFFAKNLKLSKTFVFVVLMPQVHQDAKFWALFVPGIEKALSELESYNIRCDIFYYNRNDEQSFIQTARLAMENNPDGMIIAPVKNRSIEEFVNNLPETIPYVFIDSKIGNEKFLSFVGQNQYQSGRLAGYLMHLIAPDLQKPVAVFSSHTAEFQIGERVRGFVDYWAAAGRNNLNYYDVTGVEDSILYYELAKKCLESCTNIQGIFVSNTYAHGVSQYLTEAGKSEVRLIGYDAVPDNITEVQKGGIDFIINMRPDLQAYQAFYQLYYSVVMHRSVAHEFKMPLDLLTKENINHYQY